MNYPTIQDFLENTGEACKKLNGLGNPSSSSQSLSETQNRGQSVNKYRNIKTSYNGVVYHSQKEADAAKSLDLQQKAGEIFCLQRQVSFPLKARIKYIADFVYLDKNLKVHILEVKGFWNATAKMKKKLFEEIYPIKLEIK